MIEVPESLFKDHPDRIRIHKLLYFVYMRSWIPDLHTLNGRSIAFLLSSLLEEEKSIEQVQSRLTQSAEKLNKTDAYLQVVQLIVDALRRLQPTQDRTAPRPVDRFHLRYSLMQAINPWKAKLILFVLWHAHLDSPRPFRTSMVSQYSLDELLSKVMQCYPSLNTLGDGLDGLAPLLPEIEPQEIVQLSEMLKAVLRPYLASGRTSSRDSHFGSSESLSAIFETQQNSQDLTLSQSS